MGVSEEPEIHPYHVTTIYKGHRNKTNKCRNIKNMFPIPHLSKMAFKAKFLTY